MTDVCVSGQPDHRQLAAICILVLMARAAIAEIILAVGIGVLPADGNSGDARRGEARGDIGGDVEHRMAGLSFLSCLAASCCWPPERREGVVGRASDKAGARG